MWMKKWKNWGGNSSKSKLYSLLHLLHALLSFVSLHAFLAAWDIPSEIYLGPLRDYDASHRRHKWLSNERESERGREREGGDRQITLGHTVICWVSYSWALSKCKCFLIFLVQNFDSERCSAESLQVVMRCVCTGNTSTEQVSLQLLKGDAGGRRREVIQGVVWAALDSWPGERPAVYLFGISVLAAAKWDKKTID